MEKYFTQTIRSFLLIAASCTMAVSANATAWTTSTAGAVNTLSNWSSGILVPTTFTTPGDTWTITMSMTISGTATWVVGTVSSAPSTVTFATGGTLDNTGSGFSLAAVTVYGNVVNSGGTISRGGSGSTGTALNIYGNYNMTGGTIDASGSGSGYIVMNVHGNITMSGGVINRGGSGTTADTVNVYGYYSMTGGSVTAGGSGFGNVNINVWGNFSVSGPSAMTYSTAGSGNIVRLKLNSGAGTMLIDNTSTGTWSGTNIYVDTNCTAQLDGNFNTTTGSAVYGFTVNGTLICPAAYTMNGSGLFRLNGRGTLIVGSPTGINGAILTTGTKTFNDTANYGFNGSAAQVTGSYMPGVLYAPDTISVNNSAGVTLSQTTSTTGVLEFASGILNTGTYTITVPGAAGSVTGAGATSYVNGTLIKPVTGLTTVSYEVGDLSYAPMSLTLSAAATTGSFALKANNGLHPGIGSSGFSSTHIYNHYWTITDNFVSGPATVVPKATCNLTDILGGSNNYFVTQQYNGSAWLGSPLATTNTSSPYTSAPNSGIALTAFGGDYIFGRVAGTLDENTVTNAAGYEAHVFPNPNSGTFTFNLESANNEEVRVVITTVTGEKVKDFTTSANRDTVVTIDAPAGFYLLSAYSVNKYYTAKVFIK